MTARLIPASLLAAATLACAPAAFAEESPSFVAHNETIQARVTQGTDAIGRHAEAGPGAHLSASQPEG
ncbi:hypothetical protein HKW98_06655 [Stutzerimonas urumqiensis]|uniref:hypothetical protein n=1 Tax=Stutzerimonas urumqiensis TaxID=638269 RepID=UPI003BA99589